MATDAMPTRLGKLLVPLLVLGALLPRAAFASSDWRMGVSLSAAYDDNIFLADEDPEEDYVYHVMPYLGLALKNPKARLDADYRLNYAFYAQHDEQNQTAFKDVQRLASTLDLGRWDGFGATVSDRIERVSVDNQVKSTDLNDAVNRTTRNTFIARPSYLGNLSSTTTIEAAWRYEHVSYQSSEGDDRRSQSADATLRTDMTPTAYTYVTGEALRVDPSLTPAYRKYQAMFGFAREVERGVTWDCKGGWAWLRDVEQDSKDRALLWSATSTLPLGDALGLELATSRAVTQGDSQGRALTRIFSGGLVLEGKEAQGSLKLSLDDKYYPTLDQREEARSLSGEFHWKLTPRFSTDLSAGYTRLSFTPDETLIYRYRADAALGYRLEELSASLSYGFRADDSRRPTGDFIDNVITLTLSAGI